LLPANRTEARAAQQGDAPLRRSVTLTDGPLQAMNNHPSHRLRGRFSGECCVKNTQVFYGRIGALPRHAHGHIVIFLQWLTPEIDARLQVDKNIKSTLHCAECDKLWQCPGQGWAAPPAHGLNSVKHAQKVIRYRIFKIWRRRRDSNPRYAFGAYNGLANRRLQPLGHVSASWKAYSFPNARSNSRLISGRRLYF
jgi:hypothetical protein